MTEHWITANAAAQCSACTRYVGKPEDRMNNDPVHFLGDNMNKFYCATCCPVCKPKTEFATEARKSGEQGRLVE